MIYLSFRRVKNSVNFFLKISYKKTPPTTGIYISASHERSSFYSTLFRDSTMSIFFSLKCMAALMMKEKAKVNSTL